VSGNQHQKPIGKSLGYNFYRKLVNDGLAKAEGADGAIAQ